MMEVKEKIESGLQDPRPLGGVFTGREGANLVRLRKACCGFFPLYGAAGLPFEDG